MSNTYSDDTIIAFYKSASQLLVVNATEYRYLKSIVHPRQFSAENVFGVIKEVMENQDDESKHHTLFYKENDSNYFNWMNDEQLMHLFAFVIMESIIPAYAKASYYCPSEFKNSREEIKLESIKETEIKLRKAFNEGLHAYNLSQIKTDENETKDKTTDIQ